MLPPPLALDERDPDVQLEPEDRFRLIASILARGLRRLRDHPTSPPLLDPQNPGESPSTPLAFPPHDSLTVSGR